MRTLTLDEWEKKYVVESVVRFDETNTMFNRWSYDPEMRSSIKDWRFLGEVTGKPGNVLNTHFAEVMAVTDQPDGGIDDSLLFRYALTMKSQY